MGHDTFRVGDLTAVIGDNSADGTQRAGYNGLWSLRHTPSGSPSRGRDSTPSGSPSRGRETRSIFVPGIAGLNHEHIFDGETDDKTVEVFFEPRHAPMTFRKISDREAELHQPPTQTFQLESWTRFKLAEPHFIDMHYRCTAHQHVFKRGYIGLFWASYIDAPEDKSMYFVSSMSGGKAVWEQLCTQRHNDESTVRHRDDKFELTVRKENRESLFRNYSPFRFDLPLFYGNFEDHVWVVMFDRTEGVRLTHSPSGGGFNAARGSSNPAWDFQYIIPNYEVMKTYEFRLRAAFRPKCSRDEVLAMYRAWTGKA